MHSLFLASQERVWDLVKANKVLVAAHRGVGGGIIVQNTIAAYENALRHKADIVEIDVAMTTDGEFYSFHDGMEPVMLSLLRNIRTMSSGEVNELYLRNENLELTHEHVNKLTDVLEHLKGRCLINLDRSWFYWEETIALIKKMGMADQIIIKSPAEKEYLLYLQEKAPEVMYMPIARTMHDIELVKQYEVGLLAVEIMFQSEDDAMMADSFLHKLHEEQILAWVNVLSMNTWTDMCAGKDDYHSIVYGPDQYWGWCIRKGIDILQTDWPGVLKDYIGSL